MKTTQEIRNEYKEFIDNNREAVIAGMESIKSEEERSALYYDNRCTAKTLAIPKVYNTDIIDSFKGIVTTMHGICEKVISEYVKNPEFRKKFPFSKELEELILTPHGYDMLLPMARFDVFFNEETKDFYFCEINTDGTSAMNEDRILKDLFFDNPAHQYMIRQYDYKSFELFDSWVKEFLAIYDNFAASKGQATDDVNSSVKKRINVAVVDFLDIGILKEFKEFARHFQSAGVNCEVCDIRKLRFDGKHLISPSGNVIDAVYRRAVTTEIIDRLDEVAPFVEAVKNQAFFLCGSFKTQVVHNKWFFKVLFDEDTKAILTKEENAFVEAHVPRTVLFSEDTCDIGYVRTHKDEFILKPMDSYASNGVYAGAEFNETEWNEKIDSVLSADYICQDYATQYETENVDYAWGDGEFKGYINMPGLYSYGGKFAGVYSRMSDGKIIASHRNERTVPTYYI